MSIIFKGRFYKKYLNDLKINQKQSNYFSDGNLNEEDMQHLLVRDYHCYKNGIAYMDIRLFSLFKVQYLDGENMNIAETVTFFNDMCCMAPPTLIDKRINWLDTQKQFTVTLKGTFAMGLSPLAI